LHAETHIPICIAAAALFLLLGRYPEFDDPADRTAA
jgi:hypothetical protein